MLQKLFSYRVVPLLRHGLLFWLESVASEWKLLSHSYNMALLEATTFSNMLFMMHFKVWKQITFSMKCKTHRKHITITAFFSAAQVSAGWISAIDLLRQLCLQISASQKTNSVKRDIAQTALLACLHLHLRNAMAFGLNSVQDTTVRRQTLWAQRTMKAIPLITNGLQRAQHLIKHKSQLDKQCCQTLYPDTLLSYIYTTKLFFDCIATT